jgi:hypothetical protein
MLRIHLDRDNNRVAPTPTGEAVIKIIKSVPFLFIATITMGVDECSVTPTPTVDTGVEAEPTGYDVVEVRQFGRGCTAGEPVEDVIPTDGGIVTAVVGVSVAKSTDERGGYNMIEALSDWTATTDGFLIVTCPETEPATVAYVAYVAVTL